MMKPDMNDIKKSWVVAVGICHSAYTLVTGMTERALRCREPMASHICASIGQSQM